MPLFQYRRGGLRFSEKCENGTKTFTCNANVWIGVNTTEKNNPLASLSSHLLLENRSIGNDHRTFANGLAEGLNGGFLLKIIFFAKMPPTFFDK